MSISLLANALSASGLTCAGLELETPKADAPTDEVVASQSVATAHVDSEINLLVIPKSEPEIGFDAIYSISSQAIAVPELVFAAPSGVLPHTQMVRRRDAVSASFKELHLLGKVEDGARFDFSLESQRGFLAPNAAARGDRARINPEAPNLYLFLGANDEALVWGVAGKKRSVVTLRDQLTLGDLQMGFAWATEFGRTALGLVERKLKYNDRTGDHDVSLREHFAAISYSLKL